MLGNIWKDRNCGLGHIVVCLWLVIFTDLPRVNASDDLKPEVQKFFSDYFETARRYDVPAMIERLSRSALARNFHPIVRSESDNAIKRSVLLLFNTEFIFARYCRFHIVAIEQHDEETRVRILLERTIERPRAGPIYDFFLVKESGGLRLDRKVFFREDKLSESVADIDLCDVPINWDNPALLMPGESAEDQQRRLGIPRLGIP